MKYKFTAEDLMGTDLDNPIKCYYKEACYIAKRHGVHISTLEIDTDHACGDICIFVDGKWKGYIDFWFYQEMDGYPDCEHYYEDYEK